MRLRLRHGLWFAAMKLPKIGSRSECAAPTEAIAGAASLPRTRYEALLDPRNFSSCVAPQGMSLEHQLYRLFGRWMRDGAISPFRGGRPGPLDLNSPPDGSVQMTRAIWISSSERQHEFPGSERGLCG